MRDGLRSILQMLSAAPGTVVVVDVPRANGRAKTPATVRALTPRGKMKQKTMATAPRTVKAKSKAVAKGSLKKRSRASA